MKINYSIVCFLVLYVGVNVASESVVNFANVTRNIGNSCPTLENAADLTQTQLVDALTAPCRYDRSQRPYGGLIVDTPVDVTVRVYVYDLQNLDSNNLQFSMHGLVQFRYNDPRLAFQSYAPLRDQTIVGESSLRSLIWVPHIFLANEHDSSVLGTNAKDVLTNIGPDGTVTVSSRIQATLFCWMKLEKFPFDEQFCPTVLESWMYNASDLLLHWEQNTPIAFDPQMRLTEYSLQGHWTNETIINADLEDLRHGAFVGRYSSLSFTVHVTREISFYMMDYFVPSMMIVATSWISFWIKADSTPARTTFGTSTMLAFIVLAARQELYLPKVNYVKISEIWFLVCIVFIFCSLVEFAISYNCYRRKNNVLVNEVKCKYVLKSIYAPVFEDITKEQPENDMEVQAKGKSTTMTPLEQSLWVDKKARIIFPLLFIIFNVLFWTLVYLLE